MDLTLTEFKKLIDLYINDSLSDADLVFQDLIVPISAVIEAATILEDSYEVEEKNYLIKNIYETLVDPHPIPMEAQILQDAIDRKMKNHNKRK